MLERVEGRRRSAVDIAEGVVTLIWTKDRSDTVDEIVRALSEGRRFEPQLATDSTLYALTICANAARVVVADWHVTSLHQAVSAIRRCPASLRQITDVLGAERSLSIELSGAFLRGAPLPRAALTAALRRLSRLVDDEDERLIGRVIALSLDPIAGPAHAAGRLFGVSEQIQALLEGTARAAVLRKRYLAAAAARPAAIFPSLLRPLERRTPATRRLRELYRLKALLSETTLPPSLSLEEQGLFALGYLQQREAVLADIGFNPRSRRATATASRRRAGAQQYR
jgi:CRISPR-associated protein Csd1